MQDTDVIFSEEFADAIDDLHSKCGYKEMFLISDSCSAGTIFVKIRSPGVYAIGSSTWNEKSISQGFCSYINQPKQDLFSAETIDYLSTRLPLAKESLSVVDLVDFYTYDRVKAHTLVTSTLEERSAREVKLKDYFDAKRLGGGTDTILDLSPQFKAKLSEYLQ
jgi:glycosylphosphatidylinositol transamidase (GPIT) subunit GPI8